MILEDPSARAANECDSSSTTKALCSGSSSLSVMIS